MAFNVTVRVSYRSRMMPEDTALALAVVQDYVAMLPEAAFAWYMDSSNGLHTLSAKRWATVMATTDKFARKAGTVGWADPSEAEIEISIMPGSNLRSDSKSEWEAFFGGRKSSDA